MNPWHVLISLHLLFLLTVPKIPLPRLSSVSAGAVLNPPALVCHLDHTSRRRHSDLGLRRRAELFVNRRTTDASLAAKTTATSERRIFGDLQFARSLDEMMVITDTSERVDEEDLRRDWLPLSFPRVTVSATDRDPSDFITQVTGCAGRWAR